MLVGSRICRLQCTVFADAYMYMQRGNKFTGSCEDTFASGLGGRIAGKNKTEKIEIAEFPRAGDAMRAGNTLQFSSTVAGDSPSLVSPV